MFINLLVNGGIRRIKIEHNEEIVREIWNRIMIEIWSIIPTSLYVPVYCTHYSDIRLF